ncbi:hypothetical protein O181_099393, partial [Austropuccinia psidii MF-1]|nr:hypothetical protein [Austropuccinia psidii MF-1]
MSRATDSRSIYTYLLLLCTSFTKCNSSWIIGSDSLCLWVKSVLFLPLYPCLFLETTWDFEEWGLLANDLLVAEWFEAPGELGWSTPCAPGQISHQLLAIDFTSHRASRQCQSSHVSHENVTQSPNPFQHYAQ